MDTTVAQSAIKLLQTEASSLNPSALITLFELDIGSLADQQGIILPPSERTFRFHNNIKLYNTNIIWQGNTYILCPIQATGFDIISKGTLPTPTLRLTTVEQGILSLALLKDAIASMGDLVGVNVLRIRTFAKFLDAINFPNGLPIGFQPNPNVQFPTDTYYINRKTNENRITIEYELTSVLDLEGIKLPRRQIISKRCPFFYRGEGCLYEYAVNKDDDTFGPYTVLPILAPPVADINNNLITETLVIDSVTVMGAYQPNTTYQLGQSVYITSNGINYYFVANQNNVTVSPPNGNFWLADECSKLINGCLLRWGVNGAANVVGTVLTLGELPYGGFPATQKIEGNYY